MARYPGMISIVILLAVGLVAGGQSQPAQPRDGDVHQIGRVVVDRRARTVTLEANVVRAEYGLEFLLCKAGTRDYESILATSAEPWQVHAALLMLGLQPGRAGRFHGETYIPPRGAELQITLKWKTPDGQARQADAVDWLKLSGKAAGELKPKSWIFIGSEILPDGSYQADRNGGIIAVANLPSAVIDVPFQSNQALDNREFVANDETIAPPAAMVQVVISPRKGAERADHARALLEIDRLGRMKIDGRAIGMSSLESWAQRYTRKHKCGMVVIRCDGRAMCGLGPIVRDELKIGGVFEFDFRTVPLPARPLPRTDVQSTDSLAEWKRRFAASAGRALPERRARKLLKLIERERAELKRLDALWAGYAQAIRKELEKHSPGPATRPAGAGKADRGANK